VGGRVEEEVAGKFGCTVEERGTPPPVVEIKPLAARNCGGENGVSRRAHGRIARIAGHEGRENRGARCASGGGSRALAGAAASTVHAAAEPRI
jgi:hypothetical protein